MASTPRIGALAKVGRVRTREEEERIKKAGLRVDKTTPDSAPVPPARPMPSGGVPVSAPAPQMAAQGAPLGQTMQPVEAPPRDAAELQQRTERNATWLQQPEVQAALLQFAVSIMQPVGGQGGFGDFVGALGRSMGSAAAAASAVREGETAEEQLARENALAERKMRVEEGQLSVAERELAAKGIAGLKKSLVVGGTHPLNAQFGLGIPEGTAAKVEVTIDPTTNQIVNASVESEFGSSTTETPPEIVKLHQHADRAEELGDTVLAQQLRQRAAQLSVEFTGTRGEVIEFDESGQPTGIKKLPGGKAADEEIEANRREAMKTLDGDTRAAITARTVDEAIQIIDDSEYPNITAGGLGGLIAVLPLPTQARALRGKIETVKGIAGFHEINKLRETSSTGASGLGQVTQTEHQLVQGLISSIDQSTDFRVLKQNLRRVQFVLNDIATGGFGTSVGKMVEDGLLTQEEGINAILDEADRAAGVIIEPPAEVQKEVDEEGKQEVPAMMPEELPGFSQELMDLGVTKDKLREAWPGMAEGAKRQLLGLPEK